MIFPTDSRAAHSGEELNLNRLNSYLCQYAPEIGIILEVRQFAGGFSNLTYWLRTVDSEYVLRRSPPGVSIKGGHDMEREFRLLKLLKDHYDKVPDPLIYCATTYVLGASFYIMKYVSGIILRASTVAALFTSPERMRQLSEALVDNLVIIHSIPINETGLIQMGKPDGYVQRQVTGWIKRYEVAQTNTIPAMTRIANWLEQNYPVEQIPAFLHNDYKYDNVLYASDETNDAPAPMIKGVLDWEMATVGDPLMDLGSTLAYWSEADDHPVYRNFNLTWLPGNLTRHEVVVRYAKQSNRDLNNILFYYVFGLYKNAVIAQQIYSRWKQGYSKDSRFGHLPPLIIELINKADKSIEDGII